MAQINTDKGSAIIAVNWVKVMSMWDYDHRFWDRINYFNRNCWPVKIIANHTCFPAWIMANIIKPIINATMDKNAQSCMLEHDVPESEILNILSSYGISKGMLPTEMGGTVVLNKDE
jgi:hypothetical protein